MAEGTVLRHVIFTAMPVDFEIPDYGPRRVRKKIPLLFDFHGQVTVTDPTTGLLQRWYPGEWTVIGTDPNPPTQRLVEGVVAIVTPEEERRRAALHEQYRRWREQRESLQALVLPAPGRAITVGGADPTRDRPRLITTT